MKTNQNATNQVIKWSTPDLTDQQSFNEKNFVWVNPDLVKFLRKKLKKIKCKKNFLDHYLYFCSTIIHLKMKDKKFKDLEYTNIHFKTMVKVISKYKYTEIINNLLEWGVIECDNSVKVGFKSKGYKLLPPYDTGFKKRVIKDKKINQKLNKTKSESSTQNLSFAYEYVKTTNTWINIDKRKAQKYNKENYFNENDMDIYDSNYFSITNLSDGDYRFKIDTTGNRAHTNITNLKSDLRPFLSVENERLGQVDISNSQPLFFYLHIKDMKQISEDEKVRYRELVESGRFYEFFMERLGIPLSKRNDVKKKIIAAIFFDYNRVKESRYLKVLKEEFPAIANYIYNTKRKDHTRLASLLQKAESEFVIEKAVQEFINRFGDDYEFVSTIHDSIVVKENMLNEAEKVMKYCFNIEGITPILSTTIFNSPPNTT